MATETSPTSNLPSRAATGFSTTSEDAVPDADPTTTAGLLAERLQAWKHVVVYLEDYVTAVEKVHGRQAKEYEKVLKTVSHPLREGHHFDQSLGGIAGFFENVRSNTQAMINTNIETEKSIKGSVLPILERLHKEIKHKTKELASGAHHSAKEVEKLRNVTQKQIELLGQHTATYDSVGGKLASHDDPYIIRRGVLHRLNHQVIAENNHRNDLVAVQNNFRSFESHVLEVIQEAMEAFTQLTGSQGEKIRALHSDMLGTLQCIPRDFEWNNFNTRCADRLVNANEPPRSVDAVAFPNMEHSATKALIEGSLERKSRNKLSFGGYSTGYYVVTPSRFLHELKDSDDTRQEPKPELSIYLPDAVIGSPSGEKFNIKGKDKSGTLSSKLTGSSEISFKAHTAADAQKWFQVIHKVTGATGPAPPTPASPASTSPPTMSGPAAAAGATHEARAAEEQQQQQQQPGTSPITTTASRVDEQHKAQEFGVTEGQAPAAAQVTNEKQPAAVR